MKTYIRITLILLFPLFASVYAEESSLISQNQMTEQKQEPTSSPAEKAIKSQNQDTDKDAVDLSDEEDELPTPEAIPRKIPGNGYSKQFTGTLIAILLLIIVVFLVIWMMRRFSNNRPLNMNHRKYIKILERRPLSPNTYVYLIQVGDKQFVVAESKFQVSNVATLDWNETEADR